MVKSKSVLGIASIVIIIVAAFAIFSGVTYPRTTANIPVSFTVGVDSKTATFDHPFLDDKVQVQVVVQNGAALWRAQTKMATKSSGNTWLHKVNSKVTTAAGFNCQAEATISLLEQ